MKIDVNPVVLPPSAGIVREMKRDAQLPGGHIAAEEYDVDTILYDVFLGPGNASLFAVGPPLLNLANPLSPIVMSLNGRDLQWRQDKSTSDYLTVLAADVASEILKDQNTVRMRFGDVISFSCEIDCGDAVGFAGLVLATVQKNNRLRWISDWIRYYREVLKVDRVVIYDNASEYQDRLVDFLPPDVIVVPWNFRYGPARSSANKYLQAGAFNHCRLRFGGQGYGMNLDIDELLVVEGGRPDLLRRVDQYGVAYFDAVAVPNIDPGMDDYSYGDFEWVWPQDVMLRGYKYVYRVPCVKYVGVHRAALRDDTSIRSMLRRKWRAVARRLHTSLAWATVRIPWLDRLRSRVSEVLHQESTVEVVSKSDGYILHFDAITSGWKAAWRLETRTDIGGHVKNSVARELFAHLESSSTDSLRADVESANGEPSL